MYFKTMKPAYSSRVTAWVCLGNKTRCLLWLWSNRTCTVCLGSTCNYNGTPPFFLVVALPPTTMVVCLRWVWSVVVLYITWYCTICIVLVTAAAVVTIPWVNPLSQLSKSCFNRICGFKQVFSRQSIVHDMYPLAFGLMMSAWCHQHC